MDTQKAPSNQTQETAPIKNSSILNNKLILLIIGIFALSASFAAGSLLSNKTIQSKSNIKNETVSSSAPKIIQNPLKPDWKKPESEEKGYPVLGKDNSLSVYSLSTGKLVPTKYKSTGVGGSAGNGSSNPLASPNLLYTVFINATEGQSGDIYLLSNSTLEARKITTDSSVSYISGWSPDSKRFIYFGGGGTISERTRGQGGFPTGKTQFAQSHGTGFFSFDIESGETKNLYPVDYFETFIDNNRILVRAADPGTNDNLVTFNLDTFEADYGFVKEKFPYGAMNFSISPDGSKWTYMLSRNPTTDMSIIFADFPNKEGVDVDSGTWAEFQFPKISSDGKKIAYSKRDGYLGEGNPKYATWVYDTVTKNKTKYDVDGYVQTFIDNMIIIGFPGTKLSLIDLSSGKITKIY